MSIDEALTIALERERYHTREAGTISDDPETERERQYNIKMMYFYETAVSALVKQVPMKPLTREYSICKSSYPACPICADSLEWDPYELYQPRFCPNCGQAIDWSDT